MGDKNPPKEYRFIRAYKWQYESLLYILAQENHNENLGDKLINVLSFLIRLYYVYEEFRARVGARNLTEFSRILEEFLPTNPDYRIYKAFNQFQEELIRAEIPHEIVEEITEFCTSKLRKLSVPQAKH